MSTKKNSIRNLPTTFWLVGRDEQPELAKDTPPLYNDACAMAAIMGAISHNSEAVKNLIQNDVNSMLNDGKSARAVITYLSTALASMVIDIYEPGITLHGPVVAGGYKAALGRAVEVEGARRLTELLK